MSRRSRSTTKSQLAIAKNNAITYRDITRQMPIDVKRKFDCLHAAGGYNTPVKTLSWLIHIASRSIRGCD